MTTESKGEFATFSATVDALNALNMKEHGLSLQPYSLDMKTNEFSLEYKTEAGSCGAIGHIYKYANGRCRVSVHSDPWQDPVAWSGPHTSRGASADADTLAEFAACIRRELTDEWK